MPLGSASRKPAKTQSSILPNAYSLWPIAFLCGTAPDRICCALGLPFGAVLSTTVQPHCATLV